jgi:hypothetical protein
MRDRAPSRAQSGLTILGALFVIAIIAIGGYFGYQWYTGGEDAPTCKNDHIACMRMCRRLATDTAEAQKCQAACDRDLAGCERKPG